MPLPEALRHIQHVGVHVLRHRDMRRRPRQLKDTASLTGENVKVVQNRKELQKVLRKPGPAHRVLEPGVGAVDDHVPRFEQVQQFGEGRFGNRARRQHHPDRARRLEPRDEIRD